MKIVLCCAGGFSTTMLMEGMDVLVIGPQIAHKIDYIKPIIDPYHIPYVIVDKDTYGKMDAATVMKMALIARKKADMQK